MHKVRNLNGSYAARIEQELLLFKTYVCWYVTCNQNGLLFKKYPAK
jgi:hypothetical protein